MASKQDSKETKAAQQHEDAAEQKESKAIAGDKGADNSQDLESLLEALEGDVSSIDGEAAIGLIDEWYNVLHKSKEPELKELANGLKQLKQALSKGKATGHEIGEILDHVGEQTSDIAADADKGTKTPLRKLGKQLSKIGRSIGKAEDQEHIEHIEAITDLLEGDLEQIDSEQAIAAIDEWYALLNKSSDEGQKEIANELKQLKQALSKGKGNIGELLTRLGEQTVAAASEAERGVKGPVQRLGKLLSKTGKSIDSEVKSGS